MLDTNDFQIADRLARNIAYHAIIDGPAQTRVDLICSKLHGETAFSAVCDLKNGWIYSAGTRRPDHKALRINTLVERIDPWEIFETKQEFAPEPFELMGCENGSLDDIYGNRPTRRFINETQQGLTAQLYTLLLKTGRPKDTGRRFVSKGLRAKIAMHVRNGRSSAKPPRPVKQLLKSDVLLSTTFYD